MHYRVLIWILPSRAWVVLFVVGLYRIFSVDLDIKKQNIAEHDTSTKIDLSGPLRSVNSTPIYTVQESFIHRADTGLWSP